jgi:Ras-related protein Rab-1A
MSQDHKIKQMLENASGRPHSIPSNDYDHYFKIKITGGRGSGKSSLTRRFVDDIFFNGPFHAHRFNPEFVYKTIVVGGKSVKLQLWNEKHVFGGPCRYGGAHGVVIVYDVTDPTSLPNLRQWLEHIDRYALENINKVFVGNKCDLTTLKVINFDAAKRFADGHNIHLLETSAKTPVNVEEVFSFLAAEILERMARPTPPREEQPRTEVISPVKKASKNQCEIQ